MGDAKKELPNPKKTGGNPEIKYRVNDRPPFFLSIALAIQHILAAFAGIVAVPLVVNKALGLSLEDNTFIVSTTLFVAGLATVIQAVGIGPVGNRLPMVMGTDFTFVGPGIAVGSAFGLPGYFGATFFGSFIEIVLSRFIKPLQKFFPPLITGIVISSIGLTMIPISIDWIGGYNPETYGSLQDLLLAGIVMAVILILNQRGKGFLSSGAILIGIVVGYVVAFFMGRLDLNPVSTASWLMLPNPLRYGLAFTLSGFLAFLPAYIVTTVETIGGGVLVLKACDEEVDGDKLASGVLADGVGSLLAGFFQCGPNTSFSQNIGIIPLTGVASRFVVALAGVILMITGVFPKIGALVAIMPSPVLGGAGVLMFGMIAVGGISNFKEVEFNRRNSIILAMSLGLGLGIAFRPNLLSHLPEQLRVIFGSGMTTATLTAIFLNIVLPESKTKKEAALPE